MTTVEELPEEDQVNWWIGRISVLASGIEATLHFIYEQLQGSDGMAWSLVPPLTGQKLRGIETMLRASERSPEDVALCMKALAQIKAAQKLRNAAVHGHWTKNDPSETAWTSASAGRSAPATIEWDLAAFARCYERLRHSNVASAALMFHVTARTIADDPLAIVRAEQMKGRFVIVDDAANSSSETTVTFTDPAVNAELKRRLDVIEADFRDRWEGDLADPLEPPDAPINDDA